MKQQKKTPGRSETSTRNYFNPYEETAPNVNRNRNTYKTYSETRMPKADQRKKAKTENDKSITRKKKVPSNKRVQTKKLKLDSTKRNKQTVATPKVSVKELTPEQRRAQMRKQVKLSAAQRVKMQRKRRQRMIFRMALVMCLTIAIVWGGISLKEYMTKPTVSTQVVKMGTLDTSMQFEGVVLRNEKIVYSEESGHAKYLLAEGEKVNKEGLVYALVDESNLAATTTAKDDLETQLYNQADNEERVSNYQDERYNLDQEVKSKMEDFYNSRYETNTNYIYTLRSQLESSISSRTDLYAKEQETKNQEMVALKEEIEANIGQYQKGQSAAESGFISYQMDGYETENASQEIEEMTEAAYQKLRKAVSPSTLGPSQMSAGDPIYKVVISAEWYIVSFVDAKVAEELAIGEDYTIYFDETVNQSLSFTLTHKEEKDKKVQLVFKTNNQIGSFLDVRTVNFSIGEKAVSGLKIPVQAIVEQQLIKVPVSYCFDQGEDCIVYRQKGEVTETIVLDIQYQQDDYYYIRQDLTDANQVQLNDIIVNKENGTTHQVTDMETKQGVYVVNNKMAKFKEINILVQSEDYAIVKYSTKSQLKEMDKIISNPKSIKINQLLDDMKVQNQ